MKAMLTLFLAMTLFATGAVAQRGGRGGGGGQGGGQGGMQGGMQAGAGHGQGGMQGGMQGQGLGDQDRLRIHQRDTLRQCTDSTQRLHTQVRRMQQLTTSGNVDRAAALKQRNRIQKQLTAMNQEHERLMQGLSADQQNQYQSHIQNMTQSRERLNTTMQNMNTELQNANPDAARLRQSSDDMEREMNQLEEEYRFLNNEMNKG